MTTVDHQNSLNFRSLCLLLEKRIFQSAEAAERLYLMSSESSGGMTVGKHLRFRLTRHNYEMVRKEVRLLDLDQYQTAVMVGCGIFPATLIFLAENSTIPNLLGIDQDQSVVDLAGTLISHTGHRISFAC